MNRLFIELYLDEDVDILVADILNSYGFNALTTKKAGNLGNSDIEQLTFARSQKRTFLTHNRADFELLAKKFAESNRTHSGIICAVRRKPRNIVLRILKILEYVTAEEMKNQVRYI